MKNTLGEINNRLDITEEKVSEIEDIQRETIIETKRIKANRISELHCDAEQLLSVLLNPRAGLHSGWL